MTQATHTSPTETLAELVTAQIACALHLRGLLMEEHQALNDNNLDHLTEVCAAKLKAARQLETLGSRFEQIRPLRAGDGSAAAVAESTLAAAGLSAHWAQLSALARECRDQNRSNGALLDTRASQARNSLAALQPMPASSYGRHGHPGTAYTARVHGHA